MFSSFSKQSASLNLRGSRRFGAEVLVLAALVIGPGALHAEHHMSINSNGDLGFGYDSNVTNSESSDQTRDSSFGSGAVHAQYTRHLNLYNSVIARGSLLGEAYERFDGISNGKAVGQLRWIYRPPGGFFMPAFSLWGSAALWEFDSRMRDSTEYRLGANMTQPINTAFSSRLSATATQRDSDSRVFDLSSYSVAVNLDWSVVPSRVTVYGGYQFNDGDVTSTAAPSLQIVNWAEEIEPDDAFGGFGANQFAYRLDASTHVGSLGLNVALSRNLSLDTQVQYVEANAAGSNQYERWISNASLLARF